MTQPEQNGHDVPMPEDFESMEEFMDAEAPPGDPYSDLSGLGERKMGVKIAQKSEELGVAELSRMAYSAPIAELSKRSTKLFGYARDGNIEDPFVQQAVKATHSLTAWILDAPCVNRAGRFAVEQLEFNKWAKQMEPRKEGDDRPDMYVLLGRWSQADAFMLWARLYEDRHGIAKAKALVVTLDGEQMPLYEAFLLREKQQEDVLMEAANLPPADNMAFGARIRQYEIMRERAYDVGMGYPTHDYTAIKETIAKGDYDVHDIVHLLPWAFPESYGKVTASMMDGVAYRELLAALMSQNPMQPKMPYGQPMPQFGMWPGPMMADPSMDGDAEPDRRRAILGWFGRNGHQPQAPQPRQRVNRRRQRRGRPD